MNKEQLAAREVEIIDIASVSKDYWSKVIGANNVDLTTFKSERTGRGPLLKGWMVITFFPIASDFLYLCIQYSSSNTQKEKDSLRKFSGRIISYICNASLITCRIHANR